MPEHAHRDADVLHENLALVIATIAVGVLQPPDAALRGLGHGQAADVLARGLGEKQPAALVQRTEHGVGGELRPGGEFHLEPFRHAQGGESGGSLVGNGLTGCAEDAGQSQQSGKEKSRDGVRCFHASSLAGAGKIAIP